MQEASTVCYCRYNKETHRCVVGDCPDYVVHLSNCNYRECELCYSKRYDGKYDTSLFDRHTQDCFFNGCTTEAHK